MPARAPTTRSFRMPSCPRWKTAPPPTPAPAGCRSTPGCATPPARWWRRRLGAQFHWTNDGYASFDDFLAAMSSRKRKTIRRERRDANSCGLEFVALRGPEITKQHWDAFYAFYTSTVDRKWGSAYLTRRFFSLLSERLGDAVVLMLALNGGTPLAGALNLAATHTLHGRNWRSRAHRP